MSSFWSPYDPSFHYNGKPLTIHTARHWLRAVAHFFPKQGRNINVHAFRRGACANAFEQGAPLSDIQFFGGWTSNSVLQ